MQRVCERVCSHFARSMAAAWKLRFITRVMFETDIRESRLARLVPYLFLIVLVALTQPCVSPSYQDVDLYIRGKLVSSDGRQTNPQQFVG